MQIVGIDFHTLNFIRFAAAKQGLGDVLTIGRQELHVNDIAIGRQLDLKPTYKHDTYCEQLLVDYLGASKVESVDNSSYENATYIHDMNLPAPFHLQRRFDTVIDAGTSEHIYQVPKALENYSRFCKVGGQILHVLPANNYCGHGFWQFSPELFFSLYSEKNGYRDTTVFVSDYTDKWKWFEVSPPTGGKRVNITSSGELYVLVRTVLAADQFSHAAVQQSDYVYEWEFNKETPTPRLNGGLKGRIMSLPFVYDRLFPLYHKLKQMNSESRLTKRNRSVKAVDVNDLIRSARPAG